MTAATTPDLQTLRPTPARDAIEIVDQTRLPHAYVDGEARQRTDAARAIRTMQVRGAPLIGATAAYGLALALRCRCVRRRRSPMRTRCCWPRGRRRSTCAGRSIACARRSRRSTGARANAAWDEADAIAAEDVAANRALGEHGLRIIEALAARRQATRCRSSPTATPARWRRSAGAPRRRRSISRTPRGIPVHVWVSETRPRLQGARLTAWELREHGVPHTLIVDAAGAALMRQRRVDLVLVGADRVTRNGDVCNKIGTYEKALAARDNGRADVRRRSRSATIDWTLAAGDEIPIEERDARRSAAPHGGEAIAPVRARRSRIPAFDVTPGRLLTGLITERGICAAERAALAALFPGASAMTSAKLRARDHRDGAGRMNARGINRGKSGNVSARDRGRLSRHADRPRVRSDCARGRRRDDARRARLERSAAAVVGVALSSRHLCRPRRCQRDRARAFAVRDHARLPRPRISPRFTT